MKGFRVWGLANSRIIAFLFVLFLILYPIPYTLYPTFAATCPPGPYPNGVPIKDCFGYGGITSLGEAVSHLIVPGFSIAGTAVVIYFLIGAIRFLISGGNKEDVAAARSMITHSIIGFILLLFAFLILRFLLSSLFGITSFKLF